MLEQVFLRFLVICFVFADLLFLRLAMLQRVLVFGLSKFVLLLVICYFSFLQMLQRALLLKRKPKQDDPSAFMNDKGNGDNLLLSMESNFSGAQCFVSCVGQCRKADDIAIWLTAI